MQYARTEYKTKNILKVKGHTILMWIICYLSVWRHATRCYNGIILGWKVGYPYAHLPFPFSPYQV